MSLSDELGLKNPIALFAHEGLLNIYFTATRLKKRADQFFYPFGLTDVQFNLMMLLKHQALPNEGLTQSRLSEMMLVNRANITSLIDRMEKAQLVKRTSASGDRRCNIIKLTEQGKKTLEQVELLYANEVKNIMAVLEETDQKSLVAMLENIRTKLAK